MKHDIVFVIQVKTSTGFITKGHQYIEINLIIKFCTANELCDFRKISKIVFR